MAAERGMTAGEVTIVAHDVGPARGMERQLSDLLAGLVRAGDRVTVIARTCELPVDLGSNGRSSAAGELRFHRVRGPRRPFAIAYPWFMLAGSLVLRRHRRGIVQSTGAIVLGRVDVIAVHYCHQVATPTPSRSTWLYRAHVRLAGVLKRLGERACYRRNRAATYVCVSNGVAAEIRERFPELAARTVTVHNGIDTARFTPGAHAERALALRAGLQLDPRKLVAAFVASEWERKGLEPLIRALALTADWQLVVAGGGDERAYRALAESVGVGERVHWLGVIRSSVEVVYALADAFVLPTDYESFSLVTFEAAAGGLPILVRPVNGVRELIRDGENGLFIERDPRSIGGRLRELAQDPALRARLGAAARRSALEFDSRRMVAGYRDLYARLASDSGRARAERGFAPLRG